MLAMRYGAGSQAHKRAHRGTRSRRQETKALARKRAAENAEKKRLEKERRKREKERQRARKRPAASMYLYLLARALARRRLLALRQRFIV